MVLYLCERYPTWTLLSYNLLSREKKKQDTFRTEMIWNYTVYFSACTNNAHQNWIILRLSLCSWYAYSPPRDLCRLSTPDRGSLSHEGDGSVMAWTLSTVLYLPDAPVWLLLRQGQKAILQDRLRKVSLVLKCRMLSWETAHPRVFNRYQDGW